MNKIVIDNIHTPELFNRAYSGRDWNWYRKVVGLAINYGMPGIWLDLGAGLGFLTECAHRFGIHCIGLEGSEYAVKEALKRYPGLNIQHHFLENPLLFPDNSISTIICYQTIEHLTSDTVKFMLKESFRVLCINGVLLVFSPCRYDYIQKKEITHINLYTPSRLEKELKETGFREIIKINSYRLILGRNIFGKLIMKGLFTLFPVDFFSASANCIARK